MAVCGSVVGCVCGGAWSLPDSRPLAPWGAGKARALRAREAREPGIPPARPLSRSGSCQRLGRSPGGAAPLSWQNPVETWRQVTEREARWGLGKQPQAEGDPRPLTTILALPVESRPRGNPPCDSGQGRGLCGLRSPTSHKRHPSWAEACCGLSSSFWKLLSSARLPG